MHVWRSSIGRKIAMALTGQFLLAFLLGHALGNSTLWIGRLNAYAAHLHALPPAIWVFRLALCTVLATHVWLGVALTLENRSAKGGGYAVASYRRATLASRTMVWSGLAIGGFLVFHLLHLTLQVIHPEAAAAAHADTAGRPDVQRMLLAGLRHAGTGGVYVVGMLALGLHLFHGIASSAQTFGLNGPRSFPWVERSGVALALALAAAFLVIPAAILGGLVR
jgi:succinate dehydrogenase / fumarate reductase cytochrome b subunit